MPPKLTAEEQAMLEGKHGIAIQKAMQILVALGNIYGANRMIPVSSVQVAGVSYDNLGEAGLEFLKYMADEGGKARVLATLNPAGIDIENWQKLNVPEDFTNNQMSVLEAYRKMGITTTCTCTPYLVGNLPHYQENIAWAESSAVCYANSVIGARTNREGGPSALAAALTGRTPEYGYHLDEYRQPELTFHITFDLDFPSLEAPTHIFGALGKVIGEYLEQEKKKCIPYIRGIKNASLETLKSFCASLATFGGVALFHMEGITPEAGLFSPPQRTITIFQRDLDRALLSLQEAKPESVDFINLGCPHLSIRELATLAKLLEGKKIQKELWVTTARLTKQIADRMGYTKIIEQSGAALLSDTCSVVAPITGRFHTMATDSAKACYYGSSKHHLNTLLKSFSEVVQIALGELR